MRGDLGHSSWSTSLSTCRSHGAAGNFDGMSRLLRREPRFSAAANVQGMPVETAGGCGSTAQGVRLAKTRAAPRGESPYHRDEGHGCEHDANDQCADANGCPLPRMIYPKVEAARPFHVRSADRSLYISLITEGTYPFHEGGVSVWCDQTVRGLAPDRFRIDAITGGLDEQVCWEFPDNVVEVRRIPLWGRTGGHRPARRSAERSDESVRQALESFLFVDCQRRCRWGVPPEPAKRSPHMPGMVCSPGHCAATRRSS